MNRTLSLVLLWSVSASIGWTQDTVTPSDEFSVEADAGTAAATANPAADESSAGITFSEPIGSRQTRSRLRDAELKLAKLRETYGNQHPSVLQQQRVIQLLKSNLENHREVIETFKSARTEVSNKKDATRNELGPQHPEVVRLEALLAQIDARIQAIEQRELDDHGTHATAEVVAVVPTQIKVFSLRFCEAASTAEVLRQLITDNSFGVGADERTNSVIVTGTVEQLRATEALLRKLDEDRPVPVADSTPTAGRAISQPPNGTTSAETTWVSMVYEIVQEMKRDHDATARVYGPKHHRVTELDESIDQIRTMFAEFYFFDDETKAMGLAELFKKHMPQIEKGPDRLRAEREKLVQKNNTDLRDEISDLDFLIAWATVQQRHKERAATAGTGNGSVPNPPAVDVKDLHQQIAQLRKDYEAAEAEARELASRFRQSQDDATKQRLRTTVQRAFTHRQSLLRAELIEMQTRLLQTQRSIDMRERIADQIVDRRVEDLVNPQLQWTDSAASGDAGPRPSASSDSSKLSGAIGMGQPENASPEPPDVVQDTDISGLPPQLAVVTELEGDWYQVAATDAFGQQSEVRPYNRTFRADQCLSVWPGGSHECRVKVNTDANTIWYFSKEEDNTFMMDHYELKGDQLILRDSMEREQVFKRGQVRIPGVVPPATEQQQARWRSAVVEILVSGKSDVSDNGPRKIGLGTIVAADGTLLSHMSGGWSSVLRDWPNLDAKFDDGSVVPLEIVETSGSGFVMLRPRETVHLNHHFPFAADPPQIGDEVYVGQMVVTSLESELYGISATKVTLSSTDRRVATFDVPVWQLTSLPRIPNSWCFPVISKDGELVAITMSDTGGLLLAVPVAQLQESFSAALTPKPSTDSDAAEAP